MINENELKLVIQEKTLGTLKTNVLAIKKKVEETLPKYSADNYSVDNIKQAEDDRALLNKTALALNKERITLEDEFMQPFNELKVIVTDTCKMIKEASSKIDEIIKAKEQEIKDNKKKDIQKIFDDNIGSLADIIKLERIFNDRWLNKTYDIKDIETEIKDALNTIKTCLETIESLSSKYEVEVKTHYLETLDLNGAIQRNKELLEKEESLAKQSGQAVIEKEVAKVEKMETMASKKVAINVIDPVETYTLEITAKRSQLQALRKFLETNEMNFKKID